MIDYNLFSFSLRRSGHSGISQWIAAQVQPALMFTDANAHDGKTIRAPVNRIIKDGTLSIERSAKDFTFTDEDRASIVQNFKSVHFVFEDSNGAMFKTKQIQRIVKENKILDYAPVVVVLRDPFNLFASRLASNKTHTEVPYNKRATSWYVMQLEQYNDFVDFIFINYNKWVVDKSYRRYVAKRLRLQFTDEFYNIQANRSSFNGFDDNTYQKVRSGFDTRWESFLAEANDNEKDEYWKFLNTDKMMDLTFDYFGRVLDCEIIFNTIKKTLGK